MQYFFPTTISSSSSRFDRKSLFAATLAVLWTGCAYNVEDQLYPEEIPCEAENVSFLGDILPLIEARCTSCHSGPNPTALLDLSTFEDIQMIGLNGQLTNRINLPEMDSELMPPDGPLSECNLTIIEAWVADGCPNN